MIDAHQRRLENRNQPGRRPPTIASVTSPTNQAFFVTPGGGAAQLGDEQEIIPVPPPIAESGVGQEQEGVAQADPHLAQLGLTRWPERWMATTAA